MEAYDMGDETKQVEIDWNGGRDTVTLRKLKFGERNDLIQEATDAKLVGREIITRINFGRYKELLLLKAIVKAPFPNSIDSIRGLDADVGDTLYAEAEAIQTMEDKKK